MRLAKIAPLVFVGGAYALPVVTLPWFGQVGLHGLARYWGYFPDFEEERTVYQVLKEDSEYSRLIKAIDLSDRVVDFLDDPSKSLTFFAVPNSALPHHGKPSGGDHDDHVEDFAPSRGGGSRDIAHDLAGLVLQAEELDSIPESPDKEKRKERIGLIVRGILAYHILPEKYGSADLIQNSTYATNLTLKDGSFDYEPLRLSISTTSIPPRLKVNTFVDVTKRDTEAKNGVIHQINHPLLPPASVFQETFLVPDVFSYFTTAVQRVGLTGDIDRWHFSGDKGEKGGFRGATATTVFAPTSRAFQRLPKKLKLFLFSPFGEKALKKLLEYHVVPDFILYSDYYHNATSDESEVTRLDDVAENHDGKMVALLPADIPKPLPKPVYEFNLTLPTLLEHHHIRVHVARYKSGLPLPAPTRYSTKFTVNGHDVGPFDITARNGALHVLTTLLDPRKGHGHHGHHGHDGKDDDNSWDDWEAWLPQWAEN